MLPDWLGRRAQTHGAHAALGGADALTFAELDARVRVAARRLASIVVPGEHVALCATNGTPFAIHAHAIGRLGAVLVPVNTRLAPVEVARQLADAGVRVVLHDDACAELARSAASASGAAPHAFRRDGIAAPERDVPLRTTIDLDEPHSIIYTSGTTGASKGAVLTWGNFWWSATGSALHLGHRRDDAWLVPLPLFHVGGLSVLMRSVIGGFTAVVQPRFDPAAANAAIDAGATIVSVVAVMLERMLDERGDRPYPPHLRCVLLGGGPASRTLLERAAALRVPVALSYGLTEATSQVATLFPEDALTHLGSSGKPLPTAELRIETLDGAVAPPGTDGEIVVRGPTVARAYHGRPDATARAWRGGWFRTGDIGRIDADGYLYVLDRRSDLIISGGENVYPAEVESVLLSHPDVLEAAVVGRDDARWGRVPVAFVRLASTRTSGEALISYAEERLARYKVPRSIVVFDEPLPRNAAGKLLRRELTV